MRHYVQSLLYLKGLEAKKRCEAEKYINFDHISCKSFKYFLVYSVQSKEHFLTELSANEYRLSLLETLKSLKYSPFIYTTTYYAKKVVYAL